MCARIPNETATLASDVCPAAPQKSTLTLHYDEDDIGLEKRLLFEAANPAAALEIAAGEAAGRHARLFIDGTPLCSLLKADEDNPYWIVAASATRISGDATSPSLEELP